MSWIKSIKRACNRRILSVLLLGFSSGLPIALIGSTLQAWYAFAGVSIIGIGYLTLVGQPYVFKFLWAPIIDRIVPPFLGRRRGWMLITQSLLLLGIAWLAFLHPDRSPAFVGLVALVIAFLSASQDTTINAYQTDILPEHELGLGASSTVIGYRVALIVSGGIALILSQYLGWRTTYLIMSGAMLVGLLTTLIIAPEPLNDNAMAPKTFQAAVINPFKEFFTRYSWQTGALLLIVLILYKLGDAFALSLNTAFLLKAVHFSRVDIGSVSKIGGFAASIFGGLLAGGIMLRWSIFKSLVWFGWLQALSNLSFMWLAWVGHNFAIMTFAVIFEHFCGGLGTAAFVALLMSLCNARYTATQFALFSALTAIGRVYVGPASGYLVEAIGWTWFFFFTFVISIPGILMLYWVKPYLHKVTAQSDEENIN